MRTALSRVNASSPRSIRLAALRVPLAMKIMGANMGALVLLLGVCMATGDQMNPLIIGTLVGIIVVHPLLIVVALRPIRDLETVASRVWQGDFGARVVRSRVADAEVLRVGSMFNLLLDGLVSDRARLRALATEVIAIGDQERAAIARELHDSIAQHVAALLFELSLAARESTDSVLADRLESARDSAEHILEELRTLSYTVRPALLDDLGLEAALRKLARDSASENGLEITVDAPPGTTRLPHATEAVLYRVAEEAVRNVLLHSAATKVRVTLNRQPSFVTLEIHDDGLGFNTAEAECEKSGGGLNLLRERLTLVDGWLDITTAPGRGTMLSATVPLDATTTAPAGT